MAIYKSTLLLNFIINKFLSIKLTLHNKHDVLSFSTSIYIGIIILYIKTKHISNMFFLKLSLYNNYKYTLQGPESTGCACTLKGD